MLREILIDGLSGRLADGRTNEGARGEACGTFASVGKSFRRPHAFGIGSCCFPKPADIKSCQQAMNVSWRVEAGLQSQAGSDVP